MDLPKEALFNKKFDFLLLKRPHQKELVWDLHEERIVHPNKYLHGSFYVRGEIDGASSRSKGAYKNQLLISPDGLAFDIGFLDTIPKYISQIPFSKFLEEVLADNSDNEFEPSKRLKKQLAALNVELQTYGAGFELTSQYYSVKFDFLDPDDFALGIPKFCLNWEQKIIDRKREEARWERERKNKEGLKHQEI